MYNMAASTAILLQSSKTLLTLFLMFIVFALLPILFFSWISWDRKRYKLPPSPHKLPIIGNLHQLGFFPHKELAHLAEKHGSLMLLKLGSVRTLVVSSAESAMEIFKSHDIVISSRPSLAFFNAIFYGATEIAFAPYGEHWRKLTSLVVLNLLSNKRVREYKNIREEEMSLMMGEIDKNSRRGSPFDLGELFASLTYGITSRVAFGRKYEDEDAYGNAVAFKKLLDEGSHLAGAFNVGDFIPWLTWMNHINGLNHKIRRLSQRLNCVLEKVIDDHIRKGPCNEEAHKDVVDVMLDLRELHNKTGEGMALGMDSIKGVILDLFAAGIETTSTTLTWAMAELLKHPEIMRKAQKEIRSVIGSRDHVTEDDYISQMTYLKAVIKETFRLHPPLALLLPRETTSNFKLQSFDIPSKTRVLINAWAIGRDPNSWKDPCVFDPERFLKGDSVSARDYSGQDFELIPFGAGRRGCPGISFSIHILELVLANLLHKFDWSLPDGGKGEELDMSEKFGLSVGKNLPLVVLSDVAR